MGGAHKAGSADGIEGAASTEKGNHAAFDTSEDCLSESEYRASVPGGTRQLFLLPSVIFNDNGVTLDDMTVQDIENAAGAPVSVVSCNPCDYLPEIIKLAQDEP